MPHKLLLGIVLAAALLPASQCEAQDAASAKAFLTSAFHLYDHSGKGVDYSRRYYHSSLLGLIQADLNAAGSHADVPVAGTDLFCNCQEWDGIWILNMGVKVDSPGHARAIVSFAIYAPRNRPKDDLRKFTYILTSQHGEWRVSDILYSFPATEQVETESVRKQLQKEINSYSSPAGSQIPR